MKKRLVEIFQDQDGALSFTRTACAVLVLVWCYLAIRTWSIPDRTQEFSAMLLALYGANSVRNAVQSFAAAKAAANQKEEEKT
jgi:hypothetical protein